MGATRVKICGITSAADARSAATAGADAIGLVFYEQSPRVVTIGQAVKIANAVGPYVTVVGLFVNASPKRVFDVLQQVPLHVLQFHGDENEEYCQQFNRPWYKAIRMHPDLDPIAEMAQYPSATTYLCDAWRADKYGGTGIVFDWRRLLDVSAQANTRIILAGGLNPDNVAAAVKQVVPYAVDVSGGVESAPGIKDPAMIERFIREVNNVS